MYSSGDLRNHDTLVADRALRELQHALQAIARSSSLELSEAGQTAVELVNSFERSRLVLQDLLAFDLPVRELRALVAMQEYIAFMQTLDAGLWNLSAINDHACWQQLQELAEQTLEAFGWPVESEGRTRA